MNNLYTPLHLKSNKNFDKVQNLIKTAHQDKRQEDEGEQGFTDICSFLPKFLQ